MFAQGTRVRVCGGSGTCSDKTGTVVQCDSSYLDNRCVPIGTGDYHPFDRKTTSFIRFDDGTMSTMFNDRLTVIDDDPFAGLDLPAAVFRMETDGPSVRIVCGCGHPGAKGPMFVLERVAGKWAYLPAELGFKPFGPALSDSEAAATVMNHAAKYVGEYRRARRGL